MICTYCKREFEPHKHARNVQKFCNNTCSKEARRIKERIRHRLIKKAMSPEELKKRREKENEYAKKYRIDNLEVIKRNAQLQLKKIQNDPIKHARLKRQKRESYKRCKERDKGFLKKIRLQKIQRKENVKWINEARREAGLETL